MLESKHSTWDMSGAVVVKKNNQSCTFGPLVMLLTAIFRLTRKHGGTKTYLWYQHISRSNNQLNQSINQLLRKDQNKSQFYIALWKDFMIKNRIRINEMLQLNLKQLILSSFIMNMLLVVVDPVWELDIPRLIPCVLLSSPVQWAQISWVVWSTGLRAARVPV